MNFVPRISGGYFQNVIFQELYIHFLSTFARNMPYHRAICVLNWTRNGYIVSDILMNNYLKTAVPSSYATVL